MKKFTRNFTSDEKAMFRDKKLDHMQKNRMTPEQEKNWKRKPYSYGGEK